MRFNFKRKQENKSNQEDQNIYDNDFTSATNRNSSQDTNQKGNAKKEKKMDTAPLIELVKESSPNTSSSPVTFYFNRKVSQEPNSNNSNNNESQAANITKGLEKNDRNVFKHMLARQFLDNKTSPTPPPNGTEQPSRSNSILLAATLHKNKVHTHKIGNEPTRKMSSEKKATDYDDMMYTRRPPGKNGGGRRNSTTSNSTASFKEYEKEKHELMSIGTANTVSAKKVTLAIDQNELEKLNVSESGALNSPPQASFENNENIVGIAQAAGIINANAKKDTTSVSDGSAFFQKLFAKKKKKSFDINDLIKPSPILPMVKFDDDGDFFKEPLEIKIDDHEKEDENGHMIRITKRLVIDTKKMKKYMKQGFKFAFSQIGLLGLVVGYVILGALLFMKVESAYEKENQRQIEKNRDDFFENVKQSAEVMFNEYLKQNFHMKYNKYRNEEILLRERDHLQKSIQAQQNPFNSSQPHRDQPNNNNNNEETFNRDSSVNFFFNNNVQRSHRNRDTDPSQRQENDMGEQAEAEAAATGERQQESDEANHVDTTNMVKLDRKAQESREKPPWFVELDKEMFYRSISNHLKVLLIENDKIEDKEKQATLVREEVWTYSNSMLYSATVITTIGYGNITPKSNMGKILTIVYAMIGIPLMFMCLTNTGDLLAELFITSYSKCIRFFYKRMFKHKLKIPYSSSKFQENKEEMLNEFEFEYDNPNDRHVPIVATLGVLTAYIFAGACIFSLTEGWNILDGAYFCFITFTTIGFGDFVPGKNTLATEKRGMAALCTLYLLVGMVIMAMCIKLMQDEVIAKARYAGRRLGIIDK